MINKKVEKKSWYRRVFNSLIGEDFTKHCIFLYFGMLIGMVGCLAISNLADVEDVVQGQILAMLGVLYVVAYVYICLKYAKGALPFFCYMGVAFEHLWGWNLYGIPFYLMIPLIIFALVDNIVVDIQRRKKK